MMAELAPLGGDGQIFDGRVAQRLHRQRHALMDRARRQHRVDAGALGGLDRKVPGCEQRTQGGGMGLLRLGGGQQPTAAAPRIAKGRQHGMGAPYPGGSAATATPSGVARRTLRPCVAMPAHGACLTR